MTDKIKVCLGLPTTGTVKTKTLFSIVRMLKHSSFDYTIVTKESSILHYNREHIVKQAIENNCTHLLFIDSDMYFEADAVERLIKRDKDIIGVNANLRKLPLEPILKKEDVIEEKDGLAKVTRVCTGFLLIKLSVFDYLKEPWFFWESDENGEVVMGEDFWFSRLARNAGFDLWCDSTIKIGHIGDYIF